MPIRIRNPIWADLAVLKTIVDGYMLSSRNVDAAIDNGMRDMNALRTKLAG